MIPGLHLYVFGTSELGMGSEVEVVDLVGMSGRIYHFHYYCSDYLSCLISC